MNYIFNLASRGIVMAGILMFALMLLWVFHALVGYYFIDIRIVVGISIILFAFSAMAGTIGLFMFCLSILTGDAPKQDSKDEFVRRNK